MYPQLETLLSGWSVNLDSGIIMCITCLQLNFLTRA